MIHARTSEAAEKIAAEMSERVGIKEEGKHKFVIIFHNNI
jgi:hypothetical protein